MENLKLNIMSVVIVVDVDCWIIVTLLDDAFLLLLL